ncbi:hypothetical protein C8A05DRAFT_18605 [Staphylotrichum tortipilum]|uniref:Uncharacterized protein n=1 Tax=Staphylotrichum tortipilum TaxID=2831512 RepID=A0AAN6RQM3_9PEZI|nr:hypothetical protein C8A05DRAFT_18605 [Staphylotrichum longicolle]
MRQHIRALSLPGLLLLASSDGLVSAATGLDYGYWDIAFTSSNAASGYRWEDVYANYSRAAATTIHCHQLYDPTVGQTTWTCDDASFGYDLTAGQGQHSGITVHQTAKVDKEGTATAISIT